MTQEQMDAILAKLSTIEAGIENISNVQRMQETKLNEIKQTTPQGLSDMLSKFEKIMRDMSYKMFKG